MKKTISIPMVAALAATLMACSESNQQAQGTRVCVDKEGKHVAENLCETTTTTTVVNNGNNGMGNAFLWYYLGRSSAMPAYGYPVYGGGYTPVYNSGAYATYGRPYVAPRSSFFSGSSSSSSPSASVSRGGFGSSGGSFGGSGG